ncbi:hypothetical protein Egran_04106 [Elaphomyces granulatus]|uniref:SART-1 protein n=1 Tax=Elaphomyces granulatus TaxID=519963 RepID=A0A232LVD0_9EURO|nr:hypothetical protein Egran_04106 [Elaphomyces granulatus]
MTDALSIEQNNKIRVALGLKPLPVPGSDISGPVFRESKDSSGEDEPASTLESRHGQASQNWRKLQEDQELKRKRDEKTAAIKRARDLAQRKVKLEGQGLGQASSSGLDTKSWLMQHKKLQKKVEKERARKLAEELAERDKVAEYTASDLAGVRVGHGIGDFEGDEEQVLTLKDTTIDENEEEGDELENIELKEKEKHNENLDLKKKKPAYDPTEADGTGTILAQYDEEIEGKKRKHFTLDVDGSTAEGREAKRQEVKNQAANLDFVAEAPVSDYMDISEVKIKKPKKSKSTRRKLVDEDDIFATIEPSKSNGDSMELGSGTENGPLATSNEKKFSDISFVDDEDLQASLTMQRRAAFKKRSKVRPEDIARQLREERSQSPIEVENGQDAEEAPGLIIDETSEFVSNLQKPAPPERRERRAALSIEDQDIQRETPDDSNSDLGMENVLHDTEDKEESGEDPKQEGSEKPQISGTGLEEETTLDQGLGATLGMLKQRGLVKYSDSADLNTLHRERQRFLQEKHRRESEAEKRARLQRERDRATGKLDRLSAREREEYARWENKQRDQQESRQMADIFNREYKPDVQLKYVDDFGRLMNPKEAFKELSHQFHGKGSGKMKTEKHLKKIEEEKKREAMSALESSQHTGMNNAMGATARRNRQAGVRLA